jgi:hypothetical protein
MSLITQSPLHWRGTPDTLCPGCLEGPVRADEIYTPRVVPIYVHADAPAKHFIHSTCLIKWAESCLANRRKLTCPPCNDPITSVNGVSTTRMSSAQVADPAFQPALRAFQAAQANFVSRTRMPPAQAADPAFQAAQANRGAVSIMDNSQWRVVHTTQESSRASAAAASTTADAMTDIGELMGYPDVMETLARVANIMTDSGSSVGEAVETIVIEASVARPSDLAAVATTTLALIILKRTQN